jgi:hypothetical protein
MRARLASIERRPRQLPLTGRHGAAKELAMSLTLPAPPGLKEAT